VNPDDLACKLEELEQRLERDTNRFSKDIQNLLKLLEKPEKTHD
jgi:hypothetical protein